MHRAQRTSSNRKVLCKDTHRLPMYRSGAGNDTVTVKDLFIHVEIAGFMFHKKVVFLKSIRVKKAQYPFPGGKFAHGLLLFNGLLSSSHLNLFTSPFKFLDFLLKWHKIKFELNLML